MFNLSLTQAKPQLQGQNDANLGGELGVCFISLIAGE